MLASKDTYDAIGLYEKAIKKGAIPTQVLQEVVLNILQDPNKTVEGITSDFLVAKTDMTSTEELAKKMESGKSCSFPKHKQTKNKATGYSNTPNNEGITG